MYVLEGLVLRSRARTYDARACIARVHAYTLRARYIAAFCERRLAHATRRLVVVVVVASSPSQRRRVISAYVIFVCALSVRGVRTYVRACVHACEQRATTRLIVLRMSLLVRCWLYGVFVIARERFKRVWNRTFFSKRFFIVLYILQGIHICKMRNS